MQILDFISFNLDFWFFCTIALLIFRVIMKKRLKHHRGKKAHIEKGLKVLQGRRRAADKRRSDIIDGRTAESEKNTLLNAHWKIDKIEEKIVTKRNGLKEATGNIDLYTRYIRFTSWAMYVSLILMILAITRFIGSGADPELIRKFGSNAARLLLLK